MPAGTTPWPFDGLDMLRFRDRRAEAIGRTEKANGEYIVHERMLSRQIKVLSDAGVDEYDAELVKTVQSVVHDGECVSVVF